MIDIFETRNQWISQVWKSLGEEFWFFRVKYLNQRSEREKSIKQIRWKYRIENFFANKTCSANVVFKFSSFFETLLSMKAVSYDS